MHWGAKCSKRGKQGRKREANGESWEEEEEIRPTDEMGREIFLHRGEKIRLKKF